MEGKTMRKGGSFLVEETPAQEVFTPEDFREEHKMLIKTTEDFVKNEVVPHIEELENKNFDDDAPLHAPRQELSGSWARTYRRSTVGAASESLPRCWWVNTSWREAHSV